jgi:hypothetical protein
MQTVLERAVESYRRDRLIDELNAGYARLSSAERDELNDELSVWEATSADGLDSDL